MHWHIHHVFRKLYPVFFVWNFVEVLSLHKQLFQLPRIFLKREWFVKVLLRDMPYQQHLF